MRFKMKWNEYGMFKSSSNPHIDRTTSSCPHSTLHAAMASRATKAQLSSMFHFNDAPLSSFQNSSMIAGFSELLYDHIHMMEVIIAVKNIFRGRLFSYACVHMFLIIMFTAVS